MTFSSFIVPLTMSRPRGADHRNPHGLQMGLECHVHDEFGLCAPTILSAMGSSLICVTNGSEPARLAECAQSRQRPTGATGNDCSWFDLRRSELHRRPHLEPSDIFCAPLPNLSRS